MARWLERQFIEWKRREDGVAYIEFALIFPVLMTLMMGVFDFGNALLANQKTIGASQAVADLITRQEVVSDTELADAKKAGELVMMPFSTVPYGVDIISFQFDENDDPQLLWRDTTNMGDEAPDIEEMKKKVEGLGGNGDGVVMVTVQYNYPLSLWNSFVGDIHMSEASFARGRLTPIVTREE